MGNPIVELRRSKTVFTPQWDFQYQYNMFTLNLAPAVIEHCLWRPHNTPLATVYLELWTIPLYIVDYQSAITEVNHGYFTNSLFSPQVM